MQQSTAYSLTKKKGLCYLAVTRDWLGIEQGHQAEEDHPALLESLDHAWREDMLLRAFTKDRMGPAQQF